MRPTAFVTVLVAGSALLVSHIAAAQISGVSFQTPGEFEAADASAGDATVVLMVFRNHDSASFAVMAAPDAVIVNDTTDRPVHYKDGSRDVTPHEENIHVESRADESISATARFRGSAGSLLVRGTGIRLDAEDSYGTLRTKAAGESLRAFARQQDLVERVHRIDPMEEPLAALTVESSGAQIGFRLVADSVTSIEWHNADVECNSAACPTGGGPRSTGIPVPTGASISRESFTYIGIKGELSVVGSGTADYAVVGAPALFFLVNGTLRLPLANGDCLGCTLPDGQTLEATGNLSFEHLRPGDEPGTMHGSLGGTIAAARFDESIVDPQALLGTTVATVVITGSAVAALAKLAFSLFTRVREHDAVAHPKRRLLLDIIQATPGLSYNRLIKQAGIASGTARHHLTILRALRLIETRAIGKSLNYYPMGLDAASQGALALLQDPRMRALVDAIGSRPGISQGELIVLQRDSTRSSVQFHLGKLSGAGLVSAKRQGRFIRYYPGTTVTVRQIDSNPLPDPSIGASGGS